MVQQGFGSKDSSPASTLETQSLSNQAPAPPPPTSTTGRQNGDDDEAVLARLGYKQEFVREFTNLSVSSISRQTRARTTFPIPRFSFFPPPFSRFRSTPSRADLRLWVADHLVCVFDHGVSFRNRPVETVWLLPTPALPTLKELTEPESFLTRP